MPQATRRAACAIPEREKAQELTLPSLSDFSTPSQAHSAAQLSQQAANINRDGWGRDGSKLLRNVGQLKKAIHNAHDLMWLRHGSEGASAAEATAYYFAVAVIEEAAARLDPSFVRDLKGWSRRNLRNLDPATRAEIDADLKDHPVEITQRFLGEVFGLLDAERDATKFYDAEAIDLTEEDKVAKRKARAAQLARMRRKREGATPHSECNARIHEQKCPEVPVRTFYDRLRRSQKA